MGDTDAGVNCLTATGYIRMFTKHMSAVDAVLLFQKPRGGTNLHCRGLKST
jgi:hypothetical protein